MGIGMTRPQALRSEVVSGITQSGRVEDLRPEYVRKASASMDKDGSEGEDLQFANGALQDGHLSHGVARRLELTPDLFFQVVGVADFIDEEVEKTFGGQQTLRLEFVDGLVAHRHIAGADVENDVVVAIAPESFEP